MKIKRCSGIELDFAGKPEQTIGHEVLARQIALLGEDYRDLRPNFTVSEGDRVKAGDLLFKDRKRPDLSYVAPASGTVAEIRRGGRRTLDRLVITRDGEEARVFDIPASLERETLVPLLLEAGIWQSLRTRPFDDAPDPQATPDALFVTAIDTRPLAPDPMVVIAKFKDWFEAGLKALKALSSGPVHLCARAGAQPIAIEGVTQTGFAGPHPAGLAGTHIHMLHPVDGGGGVWHISYQEVIAIGHLLATGTIWPRRVIALAGDGIRAPELVQTTPGADLRDITAGRLIGASVRLFSGSPLDGRHENHLARFHLQVTGLAHKPPAKGLAESIRAILPASGSAIVPNAAHEWAAPAGILPVPFLRALSVGDFETARKLGALGLAEEDMALLAHVDGKRIDFAALLRRTLNDLRDNL